MKASFCPILAALCLVVRASAQDFVNLDFESATVQVNHPIYGFLDWRLAVPGWSHSDGQDTQVVYYGETHLGITQCFLLVDSLSPVWSPGAMEGEYSLFLMSGAYSYYGGGWANAFITQTGLIPADTRSVRLLATGIFRLYLNNNEIPMVSLGGSAYGGDVSAYAGAVAELKILNAARPIPTEVSVPVFADAIQFSTIAIPEPSSLALLGAGGSALWAARRRRLLCAVEADGTHETTG